MSNSENEQRVWTAEEEELTNAAREYFLAIDTCMKAGGDVQAAMLEAMPPEMRDAPGMGMMAALGGIG